MGEQKQGAIAMNVEWNYDMSAATGVNAPFWVACGESVDLVQWCPSNRRWDILDGGDSYYTHLADSNAWAPIPIPATPSPAPAEKAAKPRFAVGDTVQSQYESNPCTVERVVEDPRGFRYLVRYPNRQVYLTNGESMDLVRPSPPSPSPTALAAAKECCDAMLAHDDLSLWQNREVIGNMLATILDRRFAHELAVVEAAKVWRAIQGHACEDACCIALCDALDALSAREGGAA